MVLDKGGSFQVNTESEGAMRMGTEASDVQLGGPSKRQKGKGQNSLSWQFPSNQLPEN